MNKLEYIPEDLVKSNNNPKILLKVRNLTKVKRGDVLYRLVAAEDNDVVIYLSEHQIAPIPLTPKILSTNSFKIIRQDESGALYSKEGLDINIVASYVRNCYDICIDGNKILTDLKYCHQLQHFLFGLGINHEMEV